MARHDMSSLEKFITSGRSALLAGLMISLALVADATPASASTVVRLDLESLVANSDRIVQGTVEKVESRVEKGRVYTYTTIAVDEALKGEDTEDVRLRQVGGETEELATWVPGMPRFEKGQEVVIFVEKPEGSEYSVITGMMQGKFRVAVGPDNSTRYVVPYLGDISLVRERKTPGDAPTDSAARGSSGEVGPRIEAADPADLYRKVQPLSVFKEQVRATIRGQQETR